MRNTQAPSVSSRRYGQRASGLTDRLGRPRSATTLPASSNTTTFMLVLPMSKTATQPFIPGVPSFKMEHLDQGCGHRAAVGVGGHDVLHVSPPALHHRMLRHLVHAVVVGALEIREKRVGVGVEKDRIVPHARFAEQRLQLRPDRIVPTSIL